MRVVSLNPPPMSFRQEERSSPLRLRRVSDGLPLRERHMADDRGTAVVLCEIKRRKAGTREAQNIHQTFLDLLRDGWIVNDDVRLMSKEILRRRRYVALSRPVIGCPGI